MRGTRALVATIGCIVSVNLAWAEVTDPEFHPVVSKSSSPSGAILGESEPLLAFGHLSRNVNLKLPPARNNLVPNLALEYRSSGEQTFLGRGWDIPLDVIYRSRRFGVPKFRDIGQEPEAVSLEYRIGSEAGRLVFVRDAGLKKLFRAKRDGAFTKFYYDTTTREWIVHTRDGLERHLSVVDADPADGTRVLAWYVKTIRDTLHNEICYEYNYGAQSCNTSNNTFNRLQFIEYNRRDDGQSPSRINRVQLQWGARAAQNASYTKGWRTVLDNEQLDKITVYGYDELGNWDTVDYEIGWAWVTYGGEHNISQVQVRLNSGETLPVTTYDYQPGAIGFTSPQVIEDSTPDPDPPSSPYWDDLTYGDDQYDLEVSYIKVPGTGQRIESKLVKLVDWDGDGDLDQLVVRTQQTYPNLPDNESHWFVRLNDGQKLGGLQSLTHVPSQVIGTALERTLANQAESRTVKLIMDMNGDNRPDIVEGGYHPNSDPTYVLKIHVCLARADGTGWDPGQIWFDGFPSGGKPALLRGTVRSGDQFKPYVNTYGELVDINGDGFPDYVWIDDVDSEHAKVYLGSATGITQTSLDDGSGNGVPWSKCQDQQTCIRFQDVVDDSPYVVETLDDLRDVNGDSIPDHVFRNEAGHLHVVYGRGDAVYVNRPSVELGPGNIARVEGAAEVAGLHDMNGDGLLDRVEGPSTLCGSQPHYLVWLNSGTELGWTSSTLTCWFLPENNEICGNRYFADYYLRAWDTHLAEDIWSGYPGEDMHSGLMNALIDINGDGFVEWVRGGKYGPLRWTGYAGSASPVAETVVHDTPWCSFQGSLQKPGILKKISSDTGVDEEYSFGAVPYHAPFSVQGIKSVLRRDRNVMSPFDQYQVLYEYGGIGKYDTSQREPRGFEMVQETQAGERVIIHHYRQAEFDFGAEDLTTVSDVFNPYPWLEASTLWETVELQQPGAPPRRWLRPAWSAKRFFDPQTGAEQARRDRTFAYYGDEPPDPELLNLGLLKHVKYVGAEGNRYDELTYDVVNNDAKYIVRVASSSRTTTPQGPAAARTEYRYDDECSGGSLDKGLLCDRTVYRGPGAVDGVWSYTYDPTWGTLAGVTDPRGVVTTLTWHPDHIAPATVTVDGKTVSLSQIHFLTGLPQRRCGPQRDGSTEACWSEELDGWGRVKKVYVPKREPTGFFETLAAEVSYSPQGGDPMSPPSMAMTLYPDGPGTPSSRQQQQSWYFNGRGQVAMTAYALPNNKWGQVYQQHDKIGRPIRRWNPYQSTQSGPDPFMMDPGTRPPPDYEYAYDSLNRLVEVSAQQQVVQQTAFGVNTATVTNAVGAQTEYTFSPYGEVTTIIVDKNHQELRHDFEHNALGLLTKVKDPGQVDVYTYDYYADGTLYQSTLGTGGTRTFTRAPDGSLAAVTAPSGAQVLFTYDAMGRPATRQTISNGGLCPDPGTDRTDMFVYDQQTWNLGRLTSADFGGQYTKEYDYDGQGLPAMRALVHAGERLDVRYKSNLLGQLVEKEYVGKGGFAIGLDIGKHGLPESIRFQGTPFGWMEYGTDLQVTRSSGDFSSVDPGSVLAYDRRFYYDERRRLESTQGGVNGVAWNIEYAYRPDDNVATLSDDVRNETYSWFYDGKSRIATARG